MLKRKNRKAVDISHSIVNTPPLEKRAIKNPPKAPKARIELHAKYPMGPDFKVRLSPNILFKPIGFLELPQKATNHLKT